MSRATIIQTYDNQTVVQEYSDSFILLNAICRLSIDFKQSNAKNKENILNDWKFIFVFTDDIPNGGEPMTSYVTSEDAGKTFIFTHYKWYGKDLEYAEPLVIKENETNGSLLIMVNTTALESDKKRRDIEITVWRKN